MSPAEQAAAEKWGMADRDASEPESGLKGSGGGGTSGPMDPWQTSVEKRLDSLDGRSGRVEADVSTIKSDVAVLKERVGQLPTKPWMFTSLAGMLGFLAVIVGLIVRFIPHAG